MKDRDTITGESRMISFKQFFKESPDDSVDPRTKAYLSWHSTDARSFGFLSIDQPFTIPGSKLTFSGFGPQWNNKLFFAYQRRKGEDMVTHGDLALRALRAIFKSKQGMIEGEIFDDVFEELKQLQEPIDLSNTLHGEEAADLHRTLINFELENNDRPRQLLAPAGRIWTQTKVISFWAKEGEVHQEHLKALFDSLEVPEEQRGDYYIEFAGDIEPEKTVGEYLSNSGKKVISKEEQEAKDKKAAEDMAKAHEVAATGTKDEDVKEIIAKRNKAMSDRESQLRAQGTRPSLQTRQQTMTSESFRKMSERL